MQRVLPSHEIASSVPQSIPRVCLPDRAIFARRAARLHALAADHTLGDYLHLMECLVRGQDMELARCAASAVNADEVARAASHRMPILPAADHRRHTAWHAILFRLCDYVQAQPSMPAGVIALLGKLRQMSPAQLDAQADAIAVGRIEHIDIALAPFVCAALQVCWTALASALSPADVPVLDVNGVCPVCGSLPMASVVRTGRPHDGYRYLHCSLCETQWHMVRVKCSHCEAVEGVAYRFVEGSSQAVRAETCDQCHTYRKILYLEKDMNAEPLADDLASLALDLLMSEAGYHRANTNPLLWQRAEG